MTKKSRAGLRTWIEIDTKALAYNYEILRKAIGPKCLFMAVVKSNAYGHGLLDFSREIEKLGADWLGVDSIVEAIAIRQNGIKTNILVLGYSLPEMLKDAAEGGISITVSTFELLKEIEKNSFGKKISVHIKTDTGMHRQGFDENQIGKVISALKRLKSKIYVEGLFTHFGAAKNPAFPERTYAQIKIFKRWLKAFKKAGFLPIVHASASGGTLIFKEAHFDMVRIGIALFGLWPSKEVEMYAKSRFKLKPLFHWRTIIGEIKKVSKGQRVGYDFTEELRRNSLIAICPIGYWHGYPRNLSSVGEVIVKGRRAKVLGRVSMDMITIDVTDIVGVSVGDEVTLIGSDGKERVSADEIGAMVENSPYEIITRINPLIKRIYV